MSSTAPRGLGRRCLPNGGGGECVGCGKCGTAGGGDAAVAALRREWSLNEANAGGVALQQEFGDEAAFVAFRTHELAGHVTICGDKRHKVTPLAAPSLAAGVGGLDAEWADPATQREFGGDKAAFVAFRTHELAGHVTICGGKRRAS